MACVNNSFIDDKQLNSSCDKNTDGIIIFKIQHL